jgi:hypothetical protein
VAWPTPHAFVGGDDATSPVMQTLTDSLLFARGAATSTGARKDWFRGTNTLGVTLGTSGTAGAITLDAEDWDYANGHSTVTNTSRYVMQNAGTVEVSAQAVFAANATGQRLIYLAKNGGAEITGTRVEVASAGSAVPTCIFTADHIQVVAGDYLEVYAIQTSGGSLAVSTARLTVELRGV